MQSITHNDTDTKDPAQTGSKVMNYIIRLVVSVVILSITSYFTPGFTIAGFWPVLIAAIVISIIDSLIEYALGVDASPFGKGLTGFIVTAVVLYIAQFIVPHMAVTIIGAILAAIVIGILDAIIPGRAM
jgi:uncharacterized membrane protein YvlD (DUF360 family)